MKRARGFPFDYYLKVTPAFVLSLTFLLKPILHTVQIFMSKKHYHLQTLVLYLLNNTIIDFNGLYRWLLKLSWCI
jgi:hypothetical protein